MQSFNARIIIILIVESLVIPRLSLAENQYFPGVHYLLPAGKKATQIGAQLILTDRSLHVYGEQVRAPLKVIQYSDIMAITYSRSKHPRYKATAAAAVVLGPFALPFLFTKGKKHWLTIQAANDHMALRLSKKNFGLIIAAIEWKTGIIVEGTKE